jgi:Uma2 family endonuclease
MSTERLPFVTVEEYLEFDRNSECRNEYVFGEIVPMTGATPRHSEIAVNAVFALISGCATDRVRFTTPA